MGWGAQHEMAATEPPLLRVQSRSPADLPSARAVKVWDLEGSGDLWQVSLVSHTAEERGVEWRYSRVEWVQVEAPILSCALKCHCEAWRLLPKPVATALP